MSDKLFELNWKGEFAGAVGVGPLLTPPNWNADLAGVVRLLLVLLPKDGVDLLASVVLPLLEPNWKFDLEVSELDPNEKLGF